MELKKAGAYMAKQLSSATNEFLRTHVDLDSNQASLNFPPFLLSVFTLTL